MALENWVILSYQVAGGGMQNMIALRQLLDSQLVLEE
jgi:hypothetical protein